MTALALILLWVALARGLRRESDPGLDWLPLTAWLSSVTLPLMLGLPFGAFVALACWLEMLITTATEEHADGLEA